MNSVCIMRDIYKAIASYENEFEKAYGVCLNEAMALCSISCSKGRLSSTEISEKTGMTTSHTSKVIKSIESKALIERTLGTEDKRQMYFSLTSKGQDCLAQINCKDVEIPEILKPIFADQCSDKQ